MRSSGEMRGCKLSLLKGRAVALCIQPLWFDATLRYIAITGMTCAGVQHNLNNRGDGIGKGSPDSVFITRQRFSAERQVTNTVRTLRLMRVVAASTLAVKMQLSVDRGQLFDSVQMLITER